MKNNQIKITRYHYGIYIDHDGSDEAREAVDAIREGIFDAFSKAGTEHFKGIDFYFDDTEDVTREYQEK